jgi:hypothetical protein
MQLRRAQFFACPPIVGALLGAVTFTGHPMGTTSFGQVVSGQTAASPQAERRSVVKEAEESLKRDWARLLPLISTPEAKASFRAEFLAGFGKGREEAEHQLKEGRATIYVSGLWEPYEWLDRETGLRREGIAGCVVNAEISGRQAGHNEGVRAYIKDHGPPPNSFKRWEGELFDMNGFFEVHRKVESPLRLTIGGPAAKSPDGTREIRLVEWNHEKRDGSLAKCLAVSIRGAGDLAPGPVGVMWDQGAVDLLWGPTGSRFAVIRGQEQGAIRYQALDLTTGRVLREEHRTGPLNYSSP